MSAITPTSTLGGLAPWSSYMFTSVLPVGELIIGIIVGALVIVLIIDTLRRAFSHLRMGEPYSPRYEAIYKGKHIAGFQKVKDFDKRYLS